MTVERLRDWLIMKIFRHCCSRVSWKNIRLEKLPRKVQARMISAVGFDRDDLSPSSGGKTTCVRLQPTAGSSKDVPRAIEELRIVNGRKVELVRSGKLVKSFTGESKAIDALWVKFPVQNLEKKPPEDPDFIVILEVKRLRVYAESGEEFLVSLPCHVSKIWATPLGLLLQCQIGDDEPDPAKAEPPRPRLLALRHPLDDLTRVVCKTKPKSSNSDKNVAEWTTNRHQVVFSSTDPAVVVTYDNVKCCHSLWMVSEIDPTDQDVEELNWTPSKESFYFPMAPASNTTPSSGLPSALNTPMAR